MRLDPGTYRATAAAAIQLKRSNSIGSQFYSPTVVSETALAPGETFVVPRTVNGFYYAADDDTLERAEPATEAR